MTFPYLIVPCSSDHACVEAWSVRRLPFQPSGWMRDFRSDLRIAVKGLNGDGAALTAVYAAASAEACDVENVLFYNLGSASFPKSKTLRFERAYVPPPPPNGDPALLHYYRYNLGDPNSSFDVWSPGVAFASWSAEGPQRNSAGLFWSAVRQGSQTSIAPRVHEQNFALCCIVQTPLTSMTPLSLVKPLVDGILAASHAHDGSMLHEVTSQLARALSIPAQDIAELLLDTSDAALGVRRLLWPWREGVQWNPADDRCVACELVIEHADHLRLRGDLLPVRNSETLANRRRGA